MIERVERVAKFNPNHQPAGSAIGGQFAPEHGEFQRDSVLPKATGLRAEIQQVEDKIRGNRTESIHVWKRGELVLTKTDHKSNTVEIPNDAGPLLKDAILTHNHPGSQSFSLDDVSAAILYDMAEMRVAAKDGYNYVLKRPADGWDGLENETPLRTTWNEVHATFKAIERDVTAEGEARLKEVQGVREYLQMRETLSATHFHRVWQQVFEEVGYSYTREEP